MTHYVLIAASHGPSVVERLIGLIQPRKMEMPTGPDRFSPKEVVAHLADWEPVALSRIRAAVEQSGSQVANWDEDQMAIDHDYKNSSLEEQVKLYKERRAASVEYIKLIPADKWSNTVVHGKWGSMTVDDLVNLLVQHDMYHVEQLSGVL